MKIVTGRKPKLSRDQAEAMIAACKTGMSSNQAAKLFGVAKSTVRRYKSGQCRHYQR